MFLKSTTGNRHTAISKKVFKKYLCIEGKMEDHPPIPVIIPTTCCAVTLVHHPGQYEAGQERSRISHYHHSPGTPLHGDNQNNAAEHERPAQDNESGYRIIFLRVLDEQAKDKRPQKTSQ